MIARFWWLALVVGCGDASETTRDDTSEVAQEASPSETSSEIAEGTPDAIDGFDVDPTPETTDEDAPADVPGAVTGSACDDDDQCRSGWCVASVVGRVCVDLCVTVCEPGQACIAVDSGTDPVSVCVPIVAPPDQEVVDASDTSDGDATTADASDGIPSETSTSNEVVADAADIGPDDVADETSVGDVGPDETSVGDATTGETDTTIGSDQDGDGIPDDEDLLPCLAITLVVFNEDVTSASLMLNGSEVVSANAFPTDDAIYVTINPSPGENTLALGGQLTGSPSDTLTLYVTDSTGVVYFATVITREPGKPSDRTYTFTIDVTCP